MTLLHDFKDKPFIEAVQSFFKKLNVPFNVIDVLQTKPENIIGSKKCNENIAAIYPFGIVTDEIFDKNNPEKKIIQTDLQTDKYAGILLFGVEVSKPNPTRSDLAEITRQINREFSQTPVVVVFKYGNQLTFANAERVDYKQTWQEGEKVGKVSMLRDIDFIEVHSGHERILNNLSISRIGKNAISNFESLYKYWQDVLSVSILNKDFYNELSNWYFWAIKEVQFPNEPNQIELALNDEAYAEALKEHKGKNVIRLLTRILFIWFIKEKGLIPGAIFDEKEIAENYIDGFTPQKPEGIFSNGKYSSKYYRAILQNLFFATLNQQQGKREFRTEGKHLNASQLMRYRSYLKNPEAFVQLMEETVPFMNGGLFECLDKPHPTAKGPKGGDLIIYNDGFSDREDNTLVVPDFLFFDAEEEVDLSKDYGNAKAKNSKTRGLIAILKSYKFTITENTPIEEDVALDPELLGKVFENLLASYNPETKTTARKQTGSFYTPREIVNYMVEESLIAYLKNELESKEVDTEALEEKLHQLVSFSNTNPFKEFPDVQKKIIKALDHCKILDPACGSGAYPMGILQKMVHILHKIDPSNTEWKQRQIDRVEKAILELELLDDIETKEKSIQDLKNQIKDIEASFENNELDYGRKLYLIENCIYGVDIQAIATQISKLRFFISLVVDQKVDRQKDNFGIRPLPNLETKFVAANTLIGLHKPKNNQASLFDKREVQKLEKELKKVRHKLFSIKTPSRKRELREQDKTIREQISDLLAEDYGNETARMLANWDPYDQNTTSPFFDKGWMFDITDGFDVVIGNPPYVTFKGKEKVNIDENELRKIIELHPKSAEYKINSYALFLENGLRQLKNNGNINYIIPSTILQNEYLKNIRKHLISDNQLIEIVSFENKVFEAVTDSIILIAIKGIKEKKECKFIRKNNLDFENNEIFNFNTSEWNTDDSFVINLKTNKLENKIISNIEKDSICLENFLEVYVGIVASGIKKFLSQNKLDDNHKKYLQGKHINHFLLKKEEIFINFIIDALHSNTDENVYNQKEKILVRKTGNILLAYLDNEQYYTDQSIYNLYPKKDKNPNLKFFTALLNSKVLDFYFNNKMITNADVFPYIKGIHLKKLPIKIPKNQQPFISIVEKILSGKKSGIDTSELEHQIDIMVYHLYSLSYDEACVIDNELKEEDFERFRLK